MDPRLPYARLAAIALIAPVPGWTRASAATGWSEGRTHSLIALSAAACMAGSIVVLIVRPPRLRNRSRALAVSPKSGLFRISLRT